ncbi:hypothetical protein GCM10007160_43070 [Litchfieldella qijiaojingensis]|uniref:Uncharacterized protein n=1 Tax=Litchfieldella qijiaojingensis TaxID=980347 RepID=A0ABQ2ZDA5_9GAMM|nr:hypothetical protein [Halomonas qijiaojingensis]GGY11435.1 hypothetical protein GCM10007160_43070 [Halomonas qijiaojingensis]
MDNGEGFGLVYRGRYQSIEELSSQAERLQAVIALDIEFERGENA